MDTRKNFFEICRHFGHVPSKSLASPELVPPKISQVWPGIGPFTTVYAPTLCIFCALSCSVWWVFFRLRVGFIGFLTIFFCWLHLNFYFFYHCLFVNRFQTTDWGIRCYIYISAKLSTDPITSTPQETAVLLTCSLRTTRTFLRGQLTMVTAEWYELRPLIWAFGTSDQCYSSYLNVSLELTFDRRTSRVTFLIRSRE